MNSEESEQKFKTRAFNESDAEIVSFIMQFGC